LTILDHYYLNINEFFVFYPKSIGEQIPSAG
jgi:hypothetical protein